VFERQKFAEGSAKANNLLAWERKVFSLADLVIADTQAHADYYRDVLKVDSNRLAVIPVGADETMFKLTPMKPFSGRRLRIVFFGSFIHLQGPEVIAEAATLCPEADWLLLGDGPMRAEAEQAAKGHGHIRFEDYPGYASIPEHVSQADIVMGVFSDSKKAGRVIPNKLWQAMAGGRPVITRDVVTGAFPWKDSSSGIITVPPRNPKALADVVRDLISRPDDLPALGATSRQTFDKHGSFDCINHAFRDALAKVGVHA
jgi:glycosyltransferase involved in cell wall biosynthesis